MTNILKFHLCAIFLALSFVTAQTTDEELEKNPEFTASSYLVYPTPDKKVSITKPPKGYNPFYISHYGRHGSRFHHSQEDYNYIYETLLKADSAKALTLTGKKLLIAAQILAQKAGPRSGDLTQVGANQHKEIAKRMVKNFPQVFKTKKVKGKKVPAHVDAYASTSGRCIVSMAAFTESLAAQIPDIDIRYDSGKDLMDFICPFDWKKTEYMKNPAYTAEADKLWAQVNTAPLMNKLFSDSTYAKQIDASNFYNKLFEILSSMEGMDENLKDKIHANLCNVKNGKCDDITDSLFTVEESITRWKAQNAWWYSLLGTSPLQQTNEGTNFAKATLENILNEAKKAISQGNTAATLRFGHDTGILPLAGLMELSIANAKVDTLSNLHKQWTDFRIIPMAANLQIIFYKKPAKPVKQNKKAKNKSNPKPVDHILVKMLYNEREVTAPIPCNEEAAKNAKQKCPAAPYYRWEDFKNYYQQKL